MTTTNRNGRLILRCQCGADHAAIAARLADGAAEATRRGWRVGAVAGKRLARRWWWRGAADCPRCATERKAA